MREDEANERIAALDQFDKTLGELQQAVKDMEMRRHRIAWALPGDRAWVAQCRRYDHDWDGREWWTNMVARSRADAWRSFVATVAAFDMDVREVTIHEGRPDAFKAWEDRMAEGGT